MSTSQENNIATNLDGILKRIEAVCIPFYIIKYFDKLPHLLDDLIRIEYFWPCFSSLYWVKKWATLKKI
jgi:hypothetical protein